MADLKNNQAEGVGCALIAGVQFKHFICQFGSFFCINGLILDSHKVQVEEYIHFAWVLDVFSEKLAIMFYLSSVLRIANC